MPRIPKRLLALGGLVAGGAAFRRRRRANSPATTAPTPASTAPATPPVPAPAPVEPPPVAATPPPAPAPTPVVHTDDDFVAAEEAAAAAEARSIGGPRLDDAHGDEAFEAVAEAGGGESEGFEIGDAFPPEVESDERTVVDGEADAERVSELDEDATDRR
jgi:hypothetical protein